MKTHFSHFPDNCVVYTFFECSLIFIFEPLWQAISFKSGMNRRPMIKTTIAKTELIDWWLRTQIVVVEIID